MGGGLGAGLAAAGHDVTYGMRDPDIYDGTVAVERLGVRLGVVPNAIMLDIDEAPLAFRRVAPAALFA